jgi:hypothetical protein
MKYVLVAIDDFGESELLGTLRAVYPEAITAVLPAGAGEAVAEGLKPDMEMSIIVGKPVHTKEEWDALEKEHGPAPNAEQILRESGWLNSPDSLPSRKDHN